MAKENPVNVVGGLGFFAVLFFIFLVFKLAEIGQVATWSWLWVTAPLWCPIAAILVFVFVVVIAALIVQLFKKS